MLRALEYPSNATTSSSSSAHPAAPRSSRITRPLRACLTIGDLRVVAHWRESMNEVTTSTRAEGVAEAREIDPELPIQIEQARRYGAGVLDLPCKTRSEVPATCQLQRRDE